MAEACTAPALPPASYKKKKAVRCNAYPMTIVPAKGPTPSAPGALSFPFNVGVVHNIRQTNFILYRIVPTGLNSPAHTLSLNV